MSTKIVTAPKLYNLESAAAYLGIKRFHMHELVVKGKVPAVKQAHPEFPKIIRWVVTQEALDTYKATRKQGVGKRADGRNKFTIHLTVEELVKVQAALKDLPGVQIARSNPGKSK